MYCVLIFGFKPGAFAIWSRTNDTYLPISFPIFRFGLSLNHWEGWFWRPCCRILSRIDINQLWRNVDNLLRRIFCVALFALLVIVSASELRMLYINPALIMQVYFSQSVLFFLKSLTAYNFWSVLSSPPVLYYGI